MLSQIRLDERFLDRGGCGDEFYGDAHLKASMWLAGMAGAQSLGGDGDDFDTSGDVRSDAFLDDFAGH
jgi:hypothetical protein